MKLISFYGDVVESPEVRAEIKVTRASRPNKTHYYAQIVGAREHRLNLSPVVRFADGKLCASETAEILHTNPAIEQSAESRETELGRGNKLALLDAARGIQLGGGSKIGAGGPVDKVGVIGKIGTVPIVSDTALVGLYSSDIVLSPIFSLVKKTVS